MASAPYLVDVLRHIDCEVGHHSYIVKLKANVNTEDYIKKLCKECKKSDPNEEVECEAYHDEVFHGFHCTISDSVLERLRKDPAVEYIEDDPVLEHGSTVITQEGAPWGLQRISQDESMAGITGAQAEQLIFTYKYSEAAGEGCDVYVLDSGINTEHIDFEGRASWGYTVQGTPNRDFTGHGTHVAGIIAGKTYGVAKKANVIAVKVFDDRNGGCSSHAIKGLDWVSTVANPSERPCIVNLSVNAAKTQAFNEAIENTVALGIHVVGAAGNRGANASGFSPASSEHCITVGAVWFPDERIELSNYGPAVDIWAPGSFILSAWIDGNTSNHRATGTSQACPYVAGLVAYFISLYRDNPKPEVMKRFLQAVSVQSATNVGEGGNTFVARNLVGSKLSEFRSFEEVLNSLA